MGAPNATRIIRNIGRMIAELRAGRGWTQAHFAEVLGIAVPDLQRMDQGRQNFTLRTLVTVARKLGCEPQALWEASTTSRPKPGRPRLSG